jgi:hypothetical protein
MSASFTALSMLDRCVHGSASGRARNASLRVGAAIHLYFPGMRPRPTRRAGAWTCSRMLTDIIILLMRVLMVLHLHTDMKRRCKLSLVLFLFAKCMTAVTCGQCRAKFVTSTALSIFLRILHPPPLFLFALLFNRRLTPQATYRCSTKSCIWQ